MKYFTGAIAGIAGFFAPVGVLALCAAVFVLVNFATGMMADRHRARLKGRRWAFDTRRAWRTVHKLWLVMAGIMMAWIIDGLVIDFAYLHLANLYTGFVCGVEFWSYLENAAEISDGRLFGRLGRFMRRRIFEQLGAEGGEVPGGSGAGGLSGGSGTDGSPSGGFGMDSRVSESFATGAAVSGGSGAGRDISGGPGRNGTAFGRGTESGGKSFGGDAENGGTAFGRGPERERGKSGGPENGREAWEGGSGSNGRLFEAGTESGRESSGGGPESAGKIFGGVSESEAAQARGDGVSRRPDVGNYSQGRSAEEGFRSVRRMPSDIEARSVRRVAVGEGMENAATRGEGSASASAGGGGFGTGEKPPGVSEGGVKPLGGFMPGLETPGVSESFRAAGEDGSGREAGGSSGAAFGFAEGAGPAAEDAFGSAAARNAGRSFVYSEDIDVPQSAPEGGAVRL